MVRRTPSVPSGALAAVVLAALVAAGCKKEADITVNGTISGLAKGDSVFVSLSRDWQRGGDAPVNCTIDAEGNFALRIAISGAPKPITFVKNGTAFARLELKDPWSYDPVLEDKIGGKRFPVRVVSEGFLRVRVDLP